MGDLVKMMEKRLKGLRDELEKALVNSKNAEGDEKMKVQCSELYMRHMEMLVSDIDLRLDDLATAKERLKGRDLTMFRKYWREASEREKARAELMLHCIQH